MAWPDFDDGEPARAGLTALTQDTPISRRDNEFPVRIDHLIADLRVRPWVDRTSVRHVTDRQANRGYWDQLSDHGPVQVERWVR